MKNTVLFKGITAFNVYIRDVYNRENDEVEKP